MFRRSLDDHSENLSKVLFLKLKPKKCRIAVMEVGHIVSAEGLKADPKKWQQFGTSIYEDSMFLSGARFLLSEVCAWIC